MLDAATFLKLLPYLAIMAGVTYLIRMTPFVLFRKKIKSRFISRCYAFEICTDFLFL